jgi:Zn-dependent protease with chaperone function
VAALWGAAVYVLWQSEVPNGLDLPHVDENDHFSDEALDRADDYALFLRVNFLLSQVALVAMLGLYAWRGARFARESAAGRIGTGMLLGMIGLALVWLVQVPFGLAGHWWDRRHDITKVGYLEWAVTNYFSLGFAFLFISLAILIVMALAAVTREYWWALGAPAFVGLALLFAFVFPYLVPDLHRIEDPQIAADARELSAAQGVEEIPVRVQTVSDVTSAPNAGASGIGPSRRVILWDTLLTGPFERDEIRFVLAHEFAHHSRNHLWKFLGWYTLLAIPGVFIVARVARRRGGVYEPRAIPLALFVVVVLQLLALPVLNTIGRHAEGEADWVALETTRDPDGARALFRHFTTDGLADPTPPGWSYLLMDTHPSIAERIAMANAWEARQAP